MKLQILQHVVLIIASLSISSTLALQAGEAKKQSPNVLVIYSDDHGWADLGIQGIDQDVRTPHLDQLARDGVRFSRGYVTAPQCVPSRAGLLTGRYQQRFSVEDNNKGPLPLAEVTIAERLKSAGYVSGFTGKCHLDIGPEKTGGKASRILPDHMPHHQGFDEYFRGELRQFYASHALDGTPFVDAPHLVNDNRFRVVVQTEAALSFLDRRAEAPDRPWLLYLAWYAPHVPLESPEPWFAETPAHLPKERRQALAMIAAMDDGLGKIRARLKAMGQEDNTLIFFIGDNGAPVKPGAWNGSLNAPLTGEKGMLTDGGLRVPFLAAWPGTIPAGRVFEHPVSSLDIAATANAIAGLTNDPLLDGVNLMPFLTGQNQNAPHDALFWRWRSQAAVLEFPWKLIQLGDHDQFLFDVTKPDGELATNNRLAAHPEVASRLDAKLRAWSATLQPPGPPQSNNEQDNRFYSTHVMKTEPMKINQKQTESNTDPVQGWICRNGTLSVEDGSLVMAASPEGKGKPFLARTGLDLVGPVKLTIQSRSMRGGKASVSWRSAGHVDFTEVQTASFDWPSSSEWTQTTLELPVQGKLIHLRLTPPTTTIELQIQLIELQGEDNKKRTWTFQP